jgi:peptide/nickel transport system substrate-binding protein
MTITFNFRDDVKFHDGTDFDAEAVKFSWERLDTDLHATYYKMISSITVKDSSTVELKLVQPFAPFTSLLAGMPKSNFVIVSPAAVEEYGDLTNHPVGTGPYKFVEWIKDQSVEFERNEDYWREKPPFGKLLITIFNDAATAKLALEKGEADLLYDGLGITPAPDLASYQANADISLTTHPKPTYTSLHFWLEDPDRPTANKNVRKAIAHAIDYDAIIDELWGGFAERPFGYVPEDTLSYTDVLSEYDYDLDKAKEYMELAKAEGIETPLHLVAGYYSRAAIRRDTFLMMQPALKEIGIEIEIKTWELAAWMESYETGPHDIQISAWSALYMDPHGFALYYMEESIPYPNNPHYVNPTYEDLVQEALETSDPAARAVIYEQCWDIIADDLPSLPLWVPYTYWAVRKDISGIPDPYPLIHMYLYGLERTE